MKDSSRADARVYRYHRAPRPREFISGPPRFASPTARNLSSCEITATRKSSSIISHGDIHHQMVITGGSRVIPDLFADPVITTRNVTRRGSFIPPPPPPHKRRREIYRHRFLRLGIYRCRFPPRPGIYWCWFSGGRGGGGKNLSAPVRNSIDMFIDTWRGEFSGIIGSRKPHNPKFIDNRGLLRRGYAISYRFLSRRVLSPLPFPVSRHEIHR